MDFEVSDRRDEGLSFIDEWSCPAVIPYTLFSRKSFYVKKRDHGPSLRFARTRAPAIL